MILINQILLFFALCASFSLAKLNDKDVLDALTNQLQVNAAQNSSTEALTSYATAVQSQLGETLDSLSNTLSPLSKDQAKSVAGVLFQPYIGSLSSGARTFADELPLKISDQGLTRSTQGYLKRLDQFNELASHYGVDTSDLKSLDAKIRGHLSTQLDRRDSQPVAGLQGSMENSRQTLDTLFRQLRSGGGHNTADTLVAAITGADSQIDNTIATVSEALSPLTGGLSEAVGGFLLGPFVQSVTNGAEVMLANLAGAPIDAATRMATQGFSQSVESLSRVAKQYSLDTGGLEHTNQRIRNLIGQPGKSHTHHKRGSQPVAGLQGSMENSRQTLDTLFRQLRSGGGHNTADTLVAAITGADSQIDNTIATVSEALSPLTGGLSEAVGGFLLGPFVQSVTNGAEVMLANLAGAPIDAATRMATQGFSRNLESFSKLASRYNVDTTRLQSSNAKLQKLVGKSKRSNEPTAGLEGALQNNKQTVDTLTRQLRSAGSHRTADTLVAFITGADSQIDNAVATVGEMLSPVTGGGSEAVAGFLLGPFVQSVTNGAEVMLANLAGAPIDNTLRFMTQSFSKNLNSLDRLAVRYNIDTTHLRKVQKRIQKAVGKTKRGDDPIALYSKTVQNSEQHLETLSTHMGSSKNPSDVDVASNLKSLVSEVQDVVKSTHEFLSESSNSSYMATAGVVLRPFVRSVIANIKAVSPVLDQSRTESISELPSVLTSLTDFQHEISKFDVDNESLERQIENINELARNLHVDHGTNPDPAFFTSLF